MLHHRREWFLLVSRNSHPHAAHVPTRERASEVSNSIAC